MLVGGQMKHALRFKMALALYSCYILGGFLGSLYVYQDNKVAIVLVVMIPTIALLAYISLISHSVQPKKRLPVRRASRVARHLKAVR